MKILPKILLLTFVLFVMLLADIQISSFQLVPEAQAIFGVRRRTAVIAYSAGAAAKTTSEQQATASQPKSAADISDSTIPVGTVKQTLPAGCTAVTVAQQEYSLCAGTFYRAAFQGNTLVYVAVENPMP